MCLSSLLAAWVAGFPPWVRITLTFVAVITVIVVLIAVGFLIFSGWYSASYTNQGFQVVPRETVSERGCRQTRESLTSRIQTLNGDISAERGRLSFVEQRIGETQRACLAEVSNQPDRSQAGCLIPTRYNQRIVTFGAFRDADAPPQGASSYYRSVLSDLASQKTSIESGMNNLIVDRNKSELDRQRLDESCSKD